MVPIMYVFQMGEPQLWGVDCRVLDAGTACHIATCTRGQHGRGAVKPDQYVGWDSNALHALLESRGHVAHTILSGLVGPRYLAREYVAHNMCYIMVCRATPWTGVHYSTHGLNLTVHFILMESLFRFNC